MRALICRVSNHGHPVIFPITVKMLFQGNPLILQIKVKFVVMHSLEL